MRIDEARGLTSWRVTQRAGRVASSGVAIVAARWGGSDSELMYEYSNRRSVVCLVSIVYIVYMASV